MTDSPHLIVQDAIERGLTICLDANCIIYYFGERQPWASQLRPIFEAHDQGRIKLVTSTVTLAEVLSSAAKPKTKRPEDEASYRAELSRLEAAVRRYFNIVPVTEQGGLYAAGIRQTGSIKASDALQAAATIDSDATIFITNDERLSQAALQGCQAVFLTDLALDWIEDEFAACIDASVPNVTLPVGQMNLSLSLTLAPSQSLAQVIPPLPSADFPHLALQLSHLVAGPAAVVGLVESDADGNSLLIGLRLLPAGRPWRMPDIPREIQALTKKTFSWYEHEPLTAMADIVEQVRRFNQSKAARSEPVRRTFHLLADISRLDAEAAIDAMDRNAREPMLPHRKRLDIMRHYLSPFRPLTSLWTTEGTRVWRGEAGNAHALVLDRFRAFFALAENVLGKAGTL